MMDTVDLQPLLGNPQLPICGQPPSDDLRELVEVVWNLSGRASGPAAFDILPDAHFDLVFLIGESRCSALLAGPYTRKVTLTLEDGWELVSVRFRPGAMPHLADVKPAELVNGGAYLPRVLGMAPDSLGERLRSLHTVAARRSFLEGFFRKNRLPEKAPQSRSRQCIAVIESRAGRLSVRELSSETGMSVRTIERVFRDEVGLTPKRVIRYFRYQAALRRLRTESFRSHADLALGCGYVDQSHLIKDFNFFAGRSPRWI